MAAEQLVEELPKLDAEYLSPVKSPDYLKLFAVIDFSPVIELVEPEVDAWFESVNPAEGRNDA